MALSPEAALEVVRGRLWPIAKTERERVARIDKWLRWDHEKPHQPRRSTREYRDLSDRAQAPWGRRVVTAATDQMYAEGYRTGRNAENSRPWGWWQANGMDSRQGAFHESVVGYGLAYAVVLPGKSWLGEPMPVIRGLDPSQMVAFYEDPAWDDWPVFALRTAPTKVGDSMGWRLRLYEADGVHQLVATGSGESFKHVGFQEYGVTIGVCPVVRYTAHLDLRGRATGDIEPIIPVLGRIDQTTFDRLVVQRFASFIVRTVTGMAKPDTEETAAAEKLKLAVEDILVAEDPDTKFGTLAASPLSPFIEAHDADVRALAALSQSPAHELVGTMANLSAESLAAAEASLTRRVTRLKHGVGEDHEKTLRLGALIMGDTDAAADAESELRWRDMESRSLAQAADALGKIATMLQVPVEMLWEKIPGWTDQDVERAKQLLEDGGPLVKLMEQLAAGQAPALDPVPA